jgi:hypothetical protein
LDCKTNNVKAPNKNKTKKILKTTETYEVKSLVLLYFSKFDAIKKLFICKNNKEFAFEDIINSKLFFLD